MAEQNFLLKWMLLAIKNVCLIILSIILHLGLKPDMNVMLQILNRIV